MFFDLVCLLFFIIRNGLWILGEEDHRGKMPSYSYYFKGTCFQNDLPLLMLTLITWLKWCLSGFPLKNDPPCHARSHTRSLQGSHYVQAIPQGWQVMYYFLEHRAYKLNQLEFFCVGDLYNSPFIPQY